MKLKQHLPIFSLYLRVDPTEIFPNFTTLDNSQKGIDISKNFRILLQTLVELRSKGKGNQDHEKLLVTFVQTLQHLMNQPSFLKALHQKYVFTQLLIRLLHSQLASQV